MMKEFKMVKASTDDVKLFNQEHVIEASLIEMLMQTNTITARAAGQFEDKAIFLPSVYNWHLGKDDEGVTILVATKLRFP